MPLAVLREWFDVRPTVLTVDTAAIGDPQVLAISDPDHVPTGQLAKLIAPCVLFSEDRHLRKPSLAPPGMARGGPVRRRPGGATGQRITGNLATLPFRKIPWWSPAPVTLPA